MNVRKEIKKFAKKSDQDVLNWLLERYHMSDHWHFVAKCNFVKYGGAWDQVNRVWEPTKEGYILYNHREEF